MSGEYDIIPFKVVVKIIEKLGTLIELLFGYRKVDGLFMKLNNV